MSQLIEIELIEVGERLRAIDDDYVAVLASSMKERGRSVRDWIEWWPDDEIRAQAREHSRKPDEQYDRIETMFDGPYIELFARQRRKGWDAWGNQVDKFGEAA